MFKLLKKSINEDPMEALLQGVPKTCPLYYMFTIYLIFTENSIKLSSSMLTNNVFKYILIAIMYYA